MSGSRRRVRPAAEGRPDRHRRPGTSVRGRREIPPASPARTPAKVDYGLVAAVVGAVIAMLIIGTFAYTQRIVDATTYLAALAGSLATILSAVFVVLLARRGFGTITVVTTTIVTTAVIATAALAGVWWLQTEPGRYACIPRSA